MCHLSYAVIIIDFITWRFIDCSPRLHFIQHVSNCAHAWSFRCTCVVVDSHGHVDYVSLSKCISIHINVRVTSYCINFFSKSFVMIHYQNFFMASCVGAWRCDVWDFRVCYLLSMWRGWCFTAYPSCFGTLTLIAPPCHEAPLTRDDTLERLDRIHDPSRTCFFPFHCDMLDRHATQSSTECHDLLDIRLFPTIVILKRSLSGMHVDRRLLDRYVPALVVRDVHPDIPVFHFLTLTLPIFGKRARHIRPTVLDDVSVKDLRQLDII